MYLQVMRGKWAMATLLLSTTAIYHTHINK
ncbi:MAG: hypothetical protein ACI8RD_001874 [Bacillariaceae sp.]|jgi:hypothetical protein